MTTDRSILERHLERVEVPPFTLEQFHERRADRIRRRRIATVALVSVLVVAFAASAVGLATDRRTPAADDRGAVPLTTPFQGSWSSLDEDGAPQLLRIEPVDDGRLVVTIHDAANEACAGLPATWSGVGDLAASGALVVGAVVTCEDEEVRAEPTEIELRHDPATGELVGLDVTWRRPGADGRPIPVHDLPGFADLQPGTYVVDPDGDPATPLRVTFQVADEGWSSWFGAAKVGHESHSVLSITTVDNVVVDGCRDHRAADPAVGPSVDDLTGALARLAPFEVTEPPTDVTLHGYRGKHLELTVPDLATTGPSGDLRFRDCDEGQLHSWIAPGPVLDGAFRGYNGEPGRTEELWILDVEGTRLLIAVSVGPRAPAGDGEELRAILDSIEIVP